MNRITLDIISQSSGSVKALKTQDTCEGSIISLDKNSKPSHVLFIEEKKLYSSELEIHFDGFKYVDRFNDFVYMRKENDFVTFRKEYDKEGNGYFIECHRQNNKITREALDLVEKYKK